MINIAIIEGPDNSGKSTFISNMLEKYQDICKELKFPKKVSDGRFSLTTRSEVAIFEEMIKHLDPEKLYIVDRCYISNYVYEGLRGAKTDIYEDDWKRLTTMDNVNIIPLVITRNHIECDFEDDLISLSSHGFNLVIDRYEDFAYRHGVYLTKFLQHNTKNYFLHHFDSLKERAEKYIIDSLILNSN